MNGWRAVARMSGNAVADDTAYALRGWTEPMLMYGASSFDLGGHLFGFDTKGQIRWGWRHFPVLTSKPSSSGWTVDGSAVSSDGGAEHSISLTGTTDSLWVQAGIFASLSSAGRPEASAATISTADPQIIVCSGAVTQDVHPEWESSYLASKVATFTVTALALGLALFAPEGVFGLVLIAWSALGASLAPVLVVQLFRLPLSTATAMAMMIAAVLVVWLWHLSPYDDDIFKALPGCIAAAGVYGVARVVGMLRN